jgi:probable phosphoglycerate mutase
MAAATWVSSPLARAVETARLLGASPLIESRLIEAGWGDWEGMTLPDIRRSLGRDIPGVDYPDIEFCPPGGESGRSVHDRLKSWLVDLGTSGKPIVAVTHKGVIQAALSMASPDAAVNRLTTIEAGSFHRFRVGPRGKLSAEKLDVALISGRS